MFAFLVKRIAATVPVLFIVAVLVFLLLRLTPGDPAAIIAGDAASPENVAKIRENLGLSKPLVAQFGIWFGNVLAGDLGESYFFKVKVSTLIMQRIEPTLALSFCTIVIAVLVAVPLGVLAAWKQGGWLDRMLMGFSVMGFSIPVFVLAYILIWIVSLKLGWLPVQGYERLSGGFVPFIRHLILPSVTLSVIYIALIARVTRASVQDVLSEDYIRTARAKGLPERIVLVRHALRNALLPTITVLAVDVGWLFGGIVVVETVFSYPGLGRLLVFAIERRDLPLIQSSILIVSAIYCVANLVADLLYAYFNPKIRYGRAHS